MKKKLWNRKNRIRIGFVVLLLVTIYFVTTILSIKSTHGVNQTEGLYWQPKNTIDVAFMGTSHVHCGVNTGTLWENYGIASYDYSAAEQPLWMTYHYIKELFKYQSPRVIVLDMYGPAHYKEDYQYEWIAENIYGMKFSPNKLQMLLVSVEPEQFFQYFPSFAIYHNRYNDLDAEDFGHFFWDSKDKEAFKGYTPYWQAEPQVMPDFSEDGKDGLTAKSEEYLRKIIDYTKEKNCELILVTIPYVETAEDKKTYNQVAEIAAQEGLIFIDYNEYYGTIGIDFETDFNDNSHLNYWGSCKFTDFLGSFLVSFEGVKDHRGEAGYESWEDNAALIREELESNYAGKTENYG